MGYGDIRADLRLQPVVDAGAAGAGGRGFGLAALRRGQAVVRASGRTDRRPGARAHPGGRADVPIQQPRRTARAADDAAAYTRSGPSRTGGPSGWCSPGCCSGFAFLAKMLQAFLVVPGFAVTYLWAGPPRLRQADLADGADGRRHYRWRGLVDRSRGAHPGRRPALLRWLHQQQHPAAGHRVQRPGPARPATRPAPSEAGAEAVGGTSFGGATGILRLFQVRIRRPDQLAAARGADLAGRHAMGARRAIRTDRTRAAALLWGGWVLVTGLVFSFMSGIIHPYYMVALAPGIAALVGIGAMALWQARLGLAGRIAAAAGIAVTAGWAYILLNRTPTWLPWLRWVVVVACAGRRGSGPGGSLAGGLGVAPRTAGPGRRAPRARGGRRARRADRVRAGHGTPAHTGAIPSAGPQTAGFGGGPAGAPGGRGGFPGAQAGRAGQAGQAGQFGGAPGSNTGAGGSTGTGGNARTGTGGLRAGHFRPGAGGYGEPRRWVRRPGDGRRQVRRRRAGAVPP